MTINDISYSTAEIITMSLDALNKEWSKMHGEVSNLNLRINELESELGNLRIKREWIIGNKQSVGNAIEYLELIRQSIHRWMKREGSRSTNSPTTHGGGQQSASGPSKRR